MGPRLRQVNQNASLGAVWEISDASERPDPQQIKTHWWGGIACFSLVLLLGFLVLGLINKP